LVLLNKSDKEDWSKHDIKSHIKRFIKYVFKDWSERFNSLKDIKNNSVGMNHKKINSKTLLTKGEIEAVMNREKNLDFKTFFICLYETGMRPSELRTIKWGNIKFNVDDDLSELDVFMSKNKKHKVVFIKQGTFYLKKLQQNSKSDYVFPSRENKDLPIGDSTATRWINLMGKHIKKNIYPYLLRHSRAQELYQLVDEGKLSERVVQRTLGHSKSMRDIYSELDNKTLKEAITKTIYQIEELPPEKKHEFEEKIKKQGEEIAMLQGQMKDLVELRELIQEKYKLEKTYHSIKNSKRL
jgi:integrase